MTKPMLKNVDNTDAFILLADGKIFKGRKCGAVGKTLGELCFTTSMTGYQEVFTDPSYFGQLLVMTSVHIGNYGISPLESESESPKINGLIVRNFSKNYSRDLSQVGLEDYMIKHNLIGIQDVDTRALVRYIREKGAMNAIICNDGASIDEAKVLLDSYPDMKGMELATKVCTKEPYFLGNEESWYHVAVIDHGVKKSILSNLMQQNCYLKVFPSQTPFEVVERWNPDAYFISNGPGDPSAMPYAIDLIKKVLTINKPIFGICLGHQLLASAVGIPTYKMHNGHRGINHPVKNLVTGKCEITTQNHGFGIDGNVVRDNDEIEVTHINLNDETVEGIRLKNKHAFSVQYHPEANPGPSDSNYLFKDFIQLIDQSKPNE